MANINISEITFPRNPDLQAGEQLSCFLDHAEALAEVTLSQCFLDHPKATVREYLSVLHELIAQARLLQEELSLE